MREGISMVGSSVFVGVSIVVREGSVGVLTGFATRAQAGNPRHRKLTKMNLNILVR
jgi:hypothetical protein